MNKVTMYVADEVLRPAANKIVEGLRNVTGDNQTEVDIQVNNIGGYSGVPSFSPTWTTAISQPSTMTWFNTGTNSNVVQTYTVPNTATQTATQWVNTPYQSGTITIGSSAPLTPDQVPTSEMFEQMLIASIKQLNEAYNLGRVHGYIAGKKEGEDILHGAIEKSMGVDPLTYAEDPSPDASTSSPSL